MTRHSFDREQHQSVKQFLFLYLKQWVSAKKQRNMKAAAAAMAKDFLAVFFLSAS